MILETKRPWPLHHIDRRGGDSEPCVLLPGRHRMERRLHTHLVVEWICLPGLPFGCSLRSWLQWAPGMRRDDGGTIDWKDFECRVYDDAGRLLDEDGNPT